MQGKANGKASERANEEVSLGRDEEASFDGFFREHARTDIFNIKAGQHLWWHLSPSTPVSCRFNRVVGGRFACCIRALVGIGRFALLGVVYVRSINCRWSC